MKLIAIETLRTVLGEPSFQDVQTLLGTSLELITLPLEQIIGTFFQQANYMDLFDLRNPSTVYDRLIPTCRLTSGFLNAEVAPVVKVSTSYDNLINPDLQETDVLYSVDYEKGLLSFPQGFPGDMVTITYQAGFAPMEAPNTDVYADVHSSIVNAATMYANLVYHRLIELRDHDSDSKQKSKSTMLPLTQTTPELNMVFSQISRWFPTKFKANKIVHVTV